MALAASLLLTGHAVVTGTSRSKFCHRVTLAVAEELADFAPVAQPVFCQGWQLCVKNALSLGWIITT